MFEWFPTGGARANIDILKSKYRKLRKDAIKHQEFIEAYQRMKTNLSACNSGHQLYSFAPACPFILPCSNEDCQYYWIGVCTLLKADTTCFALTGAGKTIPIVLPRYASKPGASHMILVISCLTCLQIALRIYGIRRRCSNELWRCVSLLG
jgi:hypothetical protein